MSVSQSFVIIIAITHVLAYYAHTTAAIDRGLVRLAKNSIAVNPMYTVTPKFVLLWLQMLPPWDLPLEF
jgi:hypothetical protein